MAFQNNYRGLRHPLRHRQQPNGQKGFTSAKPPLPPRQYRDDEIHVDVVDLSFNDIRKVETGKYPDGAPIVEYLSEKQAADKGLLEAWQKAQPIEEYRKTDRD